MLAEELPVKVTMLAPEVVPEMSNTAALAVLTPEEVAIEPLPARASVPPLRMVAPV